MLENFQIRGFRCFSDFTISGLKRINLIAGKNAVGKTALLEAIRLYDQPSRNSLVELLARRDEAVVGKTAWSLETAAPLFFRGLGRESTRTARFSGLGAAVDLKVAWYRSGNDGRWVEDPGDQLVGYSDSTPLLRLARSEHRSIPLSVPLDGSELVHLRLSSPPSSGPAYVRSSSLDTTEIVRLFEDVAGTDEENEAIRVLSWIIPDAERLLTKGAGEERTIYVKRKGRPHPEPLRTFGEGAFRLTGLALALFNSRGSVCLIDEIENGIHYELFDQIWEKLSLLSQELNVQVFATTHSKDCIEAFECSYRYPHFDACFHRLERDKDRIVAIRLDNESYFSVVAGQEHEIR